MHVSPLAREAHEFGFKVQDLADDVGQKGGPAVLWGTRTRESRENMKVATAMVGRGHLIPWPAGG